jgi:hypothetical protein
LTVSVAVRTEPTGVPVGACSASVIWIDSPGATVAGSTGRLANTNIAASAPLICSPSDGIASGAVPVLVSVSVCAGPAGPATTSFSAIVAALATTLAPAGIGRSSVMRLAPSSLTYRLPLTGSWVMSSGSTKWVRPARPLCTPATLPAPSSWMTTMSSPPL